MNLKDVYINRRKFLGYFGCGCCSLLLPSCSTVPITRENNSAQYLSPELMLRQHYEQFRTKTKLITSGSQLNEIREIEKMEFQSVHF